MKDRTLTPKPDAARADTWHLRAAALMPVVLLASHTAHAQLQSSASLTDVRYEVIDLRPDDGLAAGYTLGSSVAEDNLVYSEANAFVQRGRYTGPVVQNIDKKPVFGAAVGSEVTWYAGTGRGSYDESEGFDSFAYLSDGGRSFGSAAIGLSQSHDIVTSTPERWGGVMLAPYTSLTISADATVTLTDLGTYYGEGSFLLGRTYVAWSQTNGFSLTDNLDRFTYEHGVAGSTTEQRRLQITITNDSDAPRFGSLYLGAHSTVAVVPEPSTYALMAAGLGAIVFLRRRLNGTSQRGHPPA